jgi:UDPglucose--hexose-1-phosphate uridylyltransferase
MEFRKEIRSMEILSPLVQFESEVQPIEYREDPLTGSQSRINVARAGRVRQAQRDVVEMQDIIERTRAGCSFCAENIAQKTPKLPPKLFAEGRIQRGESLLFPNLYPFAEYHAVATLTEKHFLELDQFTTEMLVNNIAVSREYIVLVHQEDEKAKCPMWIWNHLPPSGASIIHPHTQIAVDRTLAPELQRLMKKSEEYFRSHGSNYWRDLIEAEREIGERYIGENDSLAVIASYAPRGNSEVQMISKGVANLADLDERQTRDFAAEIVKILHCYKGMGVDSFNLITYSAPLMQHPDYYWLSARIISRPVFQPVYTSDAGFMERFYDVWVIETLPEDVANEMRAYF